MANKRYEGLRWRVGFGRYDGVEKFAVEELQREVQAWLPYVVEVAPAADGPTASTGHEILVGTVASNGRLAALVKQGWITIPNVPEGYTIRVGDHPVAAGQRLIAIAGHDERGTLYGVEEFNARVVGLNLFTEPATPDLLRRDFDKLAETVISDQPVIQNRGIWTWGYVIYDYRRFIDNMARLKMNRLTIWNDCVPLNCRDLIDYAHSRGVQIVLGFHWGWGVDTLKLGLPEDRRQIKETVLREYNTHYRGLGMDGIYFQTLTETAETHSGGLTIAAAACMLVNEISAELLAHEPNLLIQFGLHAVSVRNNLADLKPLDSRVVIVWEDAGDVPYSYTPGFLGYGDRAWTETWKDRLAAGEDLITCTVDFSKQLATFRPGTEFAIVPKGWICLRWGTEFENHGPFILGEQQPQFIRQRLAERQPRWDHVNGMWPKFYGRAAHFYREILKCQPPRTTVTGLVEGGVFEAAIPPSVAVFAHTIWNPHRPAEDLAWLGSSPYYKKAQG